MACSGDGMSRARATCGDVNTGASFAGSKIQLYVGEILVQLLVGSWKNKLFGTY